MRALLALLAPALASVDRPRVLAFGDSLTAGCCGRPPHPYATALCAELRRGCNASAAECVALGHPGQTAARLAADLDRPDAGLRDALARARRGGDAFDVCVLLAGTNDLLRRDGSPDQIAAHLATLHGACHAAGARSVAIAIPPGEWRRSERAGVAPAAAAGAGAAREATNARLRSSVCGSAEAAARCVFAEFPVSYADAALWSDDGVHPTPAGYDALGERLAPAVARVLSRQCAA